MIFKFIFTNITVKIGLPFNFKITITLEKINNNFNAKLITYDYTLEYI